MSSKMHRNMAMASSSVMFVLSVALASLLVIGGNFSRGVLLVVAALAMGVVVEAVVAAVRVKKEKSGEKTLAQLPAGKAVFIESKVSFMESEASSVQVQRAAAEVLGKTGGEKVLYALVQALQDSDASVRRAAAKALGEIMREEDKESEDG